MLLLLLMVTAVASYCWLLCNNVSWVILVLLLGDVFVCMHENWPVLVIHCWVVLLSKQQHTAHTSALLSISHRTTAMHSLSFSRWRHSTEFMRGFRHCYCDSIRHQMSRISHVLFVIPYHIIVAIGAIHSLDVTIISLSDTSDTA